MRYYLGFLFLIVILFVSAKLLFSGSKNPASKSGVPAVVTTLPDYASTDAEVTVITDGPILGEEQHRAVRITVSRDQRTLDVIQGYSGLVIRTQSYDNTQSAFSAFLFAINNYGFTKSRESKTAGDERGFCASGDRFIYELTNTDREGGDRRLWEGPCNPALGTFAGNGEIIRDLFQKQIPDYAALTQDVTL